MSSSLSHSINSQNKSYDIIEDDIDNDLNQIAIDICIEENLMNKNNIIREYAIDSSLSRFDNIPFYEDINSAISSLENSDNDDVEYDAKVGTSGIGAIGMSAFSSFYSDDHFDMNTDKLHEWKNASSSHSIHEYKKLTYNEIEKSLSHFYDKDNKYANEINILTSYVKGQKHLFTQSQYITQIKLYLLTFIAMGLTGTATVISPFYENKFIISIINGIATLIISLINYSKFEANSRMYLFIATHYDIMENNLEMANNRIMFMENEEEKNKLILEKLREVEFKITEIKNVGKILVPNEIGKLFPTIMFINIFSFIRKMEIEKKRLIIQFRDVKNEIRYILFKWKSRITAEEKQIKQKQRLDYLFMLKDKLKNELINYKNKYTELDDMIVNEIKHADSHKYLVWCYMISSCF